MNILLCHERFCARVGVDRVLLALAGQVRARGHRVTLLGNTIDESARSVANAACEIPAPSVYFDLDVHALRWIEENWLRITPDGRIPDVVVTAGWPFLSTISYFRQRGSRVFYADHGIIPTDGLPEVGKRVMGMLRDLKRTFAPTASGVIAVSNFVRESEAWAFRLRRVTTHVVPNGVDHIATKAEVRASSAAPRQRPLRILALGRFEPKTYKQSELVFALEDRVRQWEPAAWIGALATAGELSAAANQPSQVVPLGRPSDEEMLRLVRDADVTVSFSRWEGFNLPLAESQVAGRPCLVFAAGAHAEVVANPWLLCADVADMDAKLRALAERRAPASILNGTDFQDFPTQRRWSAVADRYLEIVAATQPAATAELAPWPPHRACVYVMDVTNACRDPANSGCVRVTRRLAAELQRYHFVEFVVWDRPTSRYVFPTREEYAQLGAFQGPAVAPEHPRSESTAATPFEPWIERMSPDHAWLLLPEIRHREDLEPILAFAARRNLTTAAIFHDAIPLQRPDLVADPVYREGHFEYMRGLARCAVNVANSHASEQALRAFWSEEGLNGRTRTCVLPGGFTGARPAENHAGKIARDRSMILCVSTLEPRKNHLRLLAAFQRARAAHPDLAWDLVLVGTRSFWSPDIQEAVEAAQRRDGAVRWLGVVSDAQLDELYRACAFTVYASEIEGFGLPIMESIWYGRPCLCHAEGVMAELAADGGCLTANLRDIGTFADALVRLMTDGALREQLAGECRRRSIKTWPDYAAEFLAVLASSYWGEIAGPEALARVP